MEVKINGPSFRRLLHAVEMNVCRKTRVPGVLPGVSQREVVTRP